MHPPFVRRLFAGVALAVATASGTAWAEPDLERAKEAYERGVRAHAAGDYQTAARAFADADAIAPATASIEAALESAMRADDAVLGTELLDRAEARTADPALARILEAARRRFAGRTGKIRVDCNLAQRCLASVDGAATDAYRAIVVRTGAHSVVVQRDDERFERLVDVGPDAVVVVSGPEAVRQVGHSPSPARPSAPRDAKTAPPSSGISPAWFFGGLALTVASGVLTTLSGLDALSTKDAFADAGCTPGASGPRPADCDARAQTGERAEARTNILLATTGVLAVVTAATGAFFVRWSPSPSGSGGVAMLGARLP